MRLVSVSRERRSVLVGKGPLCARRVDGVGVQTLRALNQGKDDRVRHAKFAELRQRQRFRWVVESQRRG